MTKKGPAQQLSDSEEGIELLMLLKEITGDGRLSDLEVQAFRQWATHVRHSDVSSIRKLVAAIDNVCNDGVVTSDEREFLFKTIESVLPAQDRAIARFRRQQAKKDEKLFAKEIKRIERDEARALAERNEPVEVLDAFVAGVRHENREAYIRANVRAGDPLYLARDRANKFSRNAIGVLDRSGVLIGYVPEEDAEVAAPLLDAGHLHRANVKKLWPARDGSIVPIMLCEVFRPDAQVSGALPQSQMPQPQPASSPLPIKLILIGVILALVVGSCVLSKLL